jgi:uncharacterized protein (TIGR03000 family)
MIRKTLTHLTLPAIASAALLFAASPAFAQHGGGHGGGGFHAGGGGFHAGGYHGGFGGYHGAYYGGGYRAGYGGYNYGYRGYRPYYRGYNTYPYYGSWYYPYYYGGWSYPYYYGSGYSPFFDSSGYVAPSGSDPVTDPNTPPTQTTDPSNVNSLAPVAAVAPANGSVNSSSEAASPASSAPANGGARITVRLPDQAELWFDGKMTTTMGQVREFTTPPLASGQNYTYTVRARWLDDDTFRDQTRTIVFAPGDKVEVSFQNPSGIAKGKNLYNP